MPSVSIVIPTYLRTDKLRECLASIAEYTNPENCSVVVVANGAIQETATVFDEFRATWQGDAKLLWFNDALGYPKACNEGIRATDSEFVILFNDDCLLLPQPKNEWIDVLLKPFETDPQVGITGPQRLWDENSEHYFLIFFCVMLRRTTLEDIGLLDESTGIGFGEDTIACIEAEHKGWKVLQVPDDHHVNELATIDPATTTLETWKHDKIHIGNFRLFHDAESTLGRMPESEEVLRRNRKMLRERYAKKKEGEVEINIDRALVTDGWMAEDELRFLAKTAAALPPNGVFVEIGSWHGRSTRAIADNLPEGCIMLAVDTWTGSSGEPEMHESAKLREGDHAHSWWWCNLHHEILAGKVIPVRMHSANAAECLNHMGLKADVIWIDADHSYEGIKLDIQAWAPLMKEGGLWCGHDYYTPEEEPFAWIGVRTCVNEMFPDAKKVAHSIWASHANPVIKESASAVYDCFPVHNELDLLEVRFNELNDIVDRWVITESRISHSNKPKPLYFQNSIQSEPERWAKWLPRITHIIVDDFDVKGLQGSELHWAIERHQRDAIMRGLTECKDHDTIIISDADEIPRAEAVKSYSIDRGLCALSMDLYYGSMNCQEVAPWREGRILTYGLLKVMTPCSVRYAHEKDLWKIENAGWHFSFMGGPEEWVKKLESTAHQEYNKPEFKDRRLMEMRVRQGADLLGRDIPYRLVEVGASFPKFVTDNIERFKANKFIYGIGTPSAEMNQHPLVETKIEADMHPESWQFVKSVKEEHPDWFKGKKILEVGSLDINGSVRQFFEDCDYEGIDVAEGEGVDSVCLAHQFIRENTYDVVISSEMLEHDRYWFPSLKQMYKNLKPGGLLIVTCAGPTRPEHGTARTNDVYSSPFTADSNYYRNISKEDLLGAIEPELFSECVIGYERGEEDLNFYGFKKAEEQKPKRVVVESQQRYFANHGTVTACVSTKDRYQTTLPLCLSAIINQTHKPDHLVVYDDSENRIPAEQLEKTSPFEGLFKLATDKGIKWRVFSTPRQGQVANHQHCLDTAETEWIWRIDDDEIPAPDCLQRLLETARDWGKGGEEKTIGAIAGLVHHPGSVGPLPEFIDGSLNDVRAGFNIQWFDWNSGPREVDHLYSTFLLRVEAWRKAGGYPRNLSSIGHREETIASHMIKRAGYKLIVTPHVKTYHLREGSGGIRSFTDHSLWEHDEQIFQSYLNEWGVNGGKPTKICTLDCGLGDHFAFLSILPKLREIHADKELILSVCYPSVFDGQPEKLISIADAKNLLGDRYDESNIYRGLWNKGWQGSLAEGMLEFFS